MTDLAGRVDQCLTGSSLAARTAAAGARTAVVIELPDGTNAVLGADGTTYVSWIAGMGPTRWPLSDPVDEVAQRFASTATARAARSGSP
jgi:hypothetical protein